MPRAGAVFSNESGVAATGCARTPTDDACPLGRQRLQHLRVSHWPDLIEAARKRLHHNVLAIALAYKLARIAWSVLARGRAPESTIVL